MLGPQPFLKRKCKPLSYMNLAYIVTAARSIKSLSKEFEVPPEYIVSLVGDNEEFNSNKVFIRKLLK